MPTAFLALGRAGGTCGPVRSLWGGPGDPSAESLPQTWGDWPQFPPGPSAAP